MPAGESATAINQRRAFLMRMVLIMWVFMLLSSGDPNARNRTHLLRGAQRRPLDQVVAEEDIKAIEELAKRNVRLLNETMSNMPDKSALFPVNISGAFTGEWKMLSNESAIVPGNDDSGFSVYSAVELNSNFSAGPGKSPFQYPKGKMKLALWSRKTKLDGLQLVRGRLDILNGVTPRQSFYVIFSAVSGFYFEKTGKLTLFLTQGYKSSHFAIEFDPKRYRDEALVRVLEEQTEEKPATRLSLMKKSLIEDLQKDVLVESANQTGTLEKSVVNKTVVSAVEESLPRVWDTDVIADSAMLRNAAHFHNYGHMSPCYFRLDMQAAERELNLSNISGESTKNKAKRMWFSGTASSTNCNITLAVNTSALEVDMDKVINKASNYAIIEMLITLLQILLLVVQLNYTSTQTRTAKVSITTIGMMAVVDVGYAFTYLSSGMFFVSLFGAFVVTAILKLVLFSVFEMRYILIIWKSRRPQEVAINRATFQRQQVYFYSRMYLCVFALLFLLWKFSSFRKFFFFVVLSFWVPQIISNMVRETPDPFHNMCLLGMTASRLFTPLYIYGCPDNFFNLIVETDVSIYDPTFCWLLVLWSIVQILVMLVQRRFGPRVLIPQRFLPAKYDYNRKIPEPLRNSDCAICMLPVNGVDIEHMLTPCNHIYHRDCLRQWLLHKMECPTCRAELPPL